MTGREDSDIGVKSVQAGAQDFLVKGTFRQPELSKSIRFSIERFRILKNLEETQRIAKIGHWEYHQETKKFEASKAVYRILGLNYKKGKVANVDLSNPDSSFHFMEKVHYDALIDGNYEDDLEITRQDGCKVIVSIRCEVEQRYDRTHVFRGIIQDISARKKAEGEVERQKERYHEIFSQSKDAIYICTLDGKLFDFNQATVDLLGATREELQVMESIHPMFSPAERFRDFLTLIKDKQTVLDFELEFNSFQDKKLNVLISGRYVENADFIGYTSTLRDITAQREAEEMRQARDLARQTAEMREKFIASVSHEMRTPMNAILGMSNLLMSSTLDKTQSDYIKSIKQSSEVLLGIINDILEMSTIHNGKVRFDAKPFNLREVIQNMVDVMQYKLEEKDLLFVTEVSDTIPKLVVGDKLRLNQILYNLVGNAIKFTDIGHVKVLVKELERTSEALRLKFIVEDTGIGIPKEKIPKIFETFSRIKQKDRLYEGTGLGLAIAKNLVEQQGGSLWADSVVGKGSQFFFEIPLGIVDPNSIEEQNPDEPADFNLDLDQDYHLLLVEDHKMNQLVARKTLENQWGNLKVTIAEHGKEAIDLLENHSYDIILMDIQMPVMDGYQTTKYIRTNMSPKHDNTPILAMTAHAHISKDQKFKEYGMDDYVLKPFEPNQLFKKIVQYLKLHQSQ